MKKILILVLAAALLACAPGAALAQGEAQAEKSGMIVVPMYVYIQGAGCTLYITAGGTAEMGAAIQCSPSVTKIKISAYLKKYVNGAYQTVDSWSETDYGSSASWSDECGLQSYGTYRLYAYFYCYVGSTMVESTSTYSTDTY